MAALDERRVVPPAGSEEPTPANSATFDVEQLKLKKQRKRTFGIGLLKGMSVTIKHLFKHNTVIQYPDEVQDLSPRTRGVIALKEENCTVCMLCARECPDWCIYIDSHKETLPPKREGGRKRKRNVLDRFAIDYALCMYCGICVDVCPYDALFWSREFEYAEYDIRELTHEKERLSDWMASVLPPPPLEEGAQLPGQPEAAGTPAVAAGAATAAPTEAQATPSQEQAGETKAAEASAAPTAPTEEKVESKTGEPKAAAAEQGEAKGPDTKQPEAIASPTEAASPAPADERAGEAEKRETQAAATAQAAAKEPGPNVQIPNEPPRPIALEHTEDPESVYKDVLQEQLDKGSSPQVAEARAKVARVKAERGIKRGPTPIQTEKMVPSAPTKGQPPEAEPGGAPMAEEPKPEQGPVAPTEDEDKK